MKLYEVPRNTMVKLTDNIAMPPGAPILKKGDVIHFSHVDGMYSYCKDSYGNIVHLVGSADVEMIGSAN